MLNHNLHIFLRVVKNKSITKTANELYISQPAISKAIKNLEDEFQLTLFHRDKRKGLSLTEIGQEIFLIASQMEDLENRMYQTAYQFNNLTKGTVRIASMPILTSVILSEVFYRYKKQYPFVTIELTEDSSIEIRKAIEEHQIDFALISAPFGNLDHQILFQDQMIALSKEQLTENNIDLNNHPERFIFCKAGHETTTEILHTHNVDISKCFLVQQAETIIDLVDKNNGIGILSQLVANHTPNSLIRYPVKPNIPIDIGLVADDLEHLTPAANVLKEMIIDYIEEIKI